MKITVIGGSGLIGSKVVSKLRASGHEVVAASLSSGVNVVTGEGVKEAVAGARVVVDVANSPSFEDQAAMEFFEKAGRNLSAAEKAAGVKAHVALSVVGTERLQESGYFRAKLAQEKAIAASGIPYTIVRATQFFEFVGPIAESSVVDGAIRLPGAMFQPMAAEDVAAAVAEAAVAQPVNGMVEIGGPEKMGLDEAVRRWLRARGDGRAVVTDAGALYFGLRVNDESLTPGAGARIAGTRFEDWLAALKPSTSVASR